ncbi:MAG: hypothetical protein WC441_02850 [Patescibacteria group bacterium]
MTLSLYEKLGIDPNKDAVREIFNRIIDNEYPGAFVNIISDPFDTKRVITQHQDGDGSKFIQRLMNMMADGNYDYRLLKGMVDDALSMNTGDIAAAGFVFGPWIITDVINFGLAKDIKKDLMLAVAERLFELRDLYQQNGFHIKFLGGETADLPDQVKSGVFDIAITAWANKKDIIKGNIQAGDVIYGFASNGRAIWEEEENSGIMSNGLTMARSVLMSKDYNQFPKFKRDGDFYRGNMKPNHSVGLLKGVTVGQALTSPTRQWAIVIRKIMEELERKNALHLLHGITMNTGGGATKIRHLGKGGIRYYKEMPPVPPLFSLIQIRSQEEWRAMYQTFNCGIGIDVVGQDSRLFRDALKAVSEECQINLHRLGECRAQTEEKANNSVLIYSPYGVWEY